ncbi:MAG: dicarboxylate/amino acid:cation symporter [Methylotenera sp.]|nr:dicarboxylate/amino acid:cation symporter [Oligoflexia bacterium]
MKTRSLYFQVLAAIALGVLLGHFQPETAASLKPLGDGFVKLIKMLIGPIIFCTIVSSFSGMDDLKKVGRVGLKSLLYFEVLTTLALIIGLVAVHVLKPGVGMNVDIRTLDTQALSVYTGQAKSSGLGAFLMNIIPSTPMDAFAQGDILQILFFSVLFGLAIGKLGPHVSGVSSFFEQFSRVLFRMIEMLMKFAPIGAFGAMAFTVGRYGVASLIPLARLMGVFYLTCGFFIFVVLNAIARKTGFSLWRLLIYIREELLIVLGTSSSESALPGIMRKLEDLGCEKSIVGLVIPAGYSFNLDGTSIYLTMAAIFVAQATNSEITLTQELTLLGILLISSKGAAGVTGSGFITLAATLSAIPTIPVAGLALILGVDRFMSEARAITNLIGNSVATLVIARWEGQLDLDKARALLKAPHSP